MKENKKTARGWMGAAGKIAAVVTFLAAFTTLLNNLGFEKRQKPDLPAATDSAIVRKEEPAMKSPENNIDSSQAEGNEEQMAKSPEPRPEPNQAPAKKTVPAPLPRFPIEAELSRSKSSRTISEIGVSVSVIFQALDGEDFATLTISHLGGAPLIEPILGPGSSFPVQGRRGRQFAVDVLQADFRNAVVKLSIREDP